MKKYLRYLFKHAKVILGGLLKSKKFARAWSLDKRLLSFVIMPLLLALVSFVFVRPTLAQLSDRQTRLSQYLVSGAVEVGNEVVDGVSRVYYIFEDEKVYVSPENQNARQADRKGEYITYVIDINGAGQVFLYNILSGSNLQITHTGTNLSPKVSREGVVVWEGWIDEGWQLFVYDGKRAYQLTQGEISKNANIEGDFIVFARKSASGFWHSVGYSLKDLKFADISVGEDSEYPRIEIDGTIFYGPPFEEQKKYPLKIQDLFILNLGSLTPEAGSGSLTVEEVLRQLEAVESASTISGELTQ